MKLDVLPKSVDLNYAEVAGAVDIVSGRILSEVASREYLATVSSLFLISR